MFQNPLDSPVPKRAEAVIDLTSSPDLFIPPPQAMSISSVPKTMSTPATNGNSMTLQNEDTMPEKLTQRSAKKASSSGSSSAGSTTKGNSLPSQPNSSTKSQHSSGRVIKPVIRASCSTSSNSVAEASTALHRTGSTHPIPTVQEISPNSITEFPTPTNKEKKAKEQEHALSTSLDRLISNDEVAAATRLPTQVGSKRSKSLGTVDFYAPVKKHRYSMEMEKYDIPDGKHHIVFANGNQYDGDFQSGQFHGLGTFQWVNGDKYEGSYVRGKREGEGTYYHHTGDLYEGMYHDNLRHGLGRYKVANGDVYEGNFNEGLMHGAGRLTYHNGNMYVGEFWEGLRSGQGKFSFHDGDVYEGDFEGDIPNGGGQCQYSNGDYYVGTFVNDQLHGFGRYIWANGTLYEGEFDKDLIHGKGKLTKQGQVFEGTFDRGTHIAGTSKCDEASRD